MTAYDAQTGAKRWWVRGLSFEMKSTPVIGDGVLFINGFGSDQNELGRKVVVPPAAEVWKTADANKDGVLQKAEFPKFTGGAWFGLADLDTNGTLSTEEWEYYRAALDSENGLLAIRLGGKGDMTDKAVIWKYQRAVPQLPSPLLYRDVLYMVNDGGIVTTINPEGRHGHQAGPPGSGRALLRVARRRRRPRVLCQRRGQGRGAAAQRRSHAGRRERPSGILLCDAGIRRRTGLHQDDGSAVRVWILKY